MDIGYVTGINPGKTVIGIRTKDGKYTDWCDVYVRYDGYKVAETAENLVGKKGSEIFELIRKKTGVSYSTEWCALFASYCYDLNYAIAPYKTLDSYKLRVLHFSKNYRSKNNYLPKPGDLIIFDEPNPYKDEDTKYGGTNDLPDHIGIVYRYAENSGRIYTIEGNVGNSNDNLSEVKTRVHNIKDQYVIGFYSLNNGW